MNVQRSGDPNQRKPALKPLIARASKRSPVSEPVARPLTPAEPPRPQPVRPFRDPDSSWSFRPDWLQKLPGAGLASSTVTAPVWLVAVLAVTLALTPLMIVISASGFIPSPAYDTQAESVLADQPEVVEDPVTMLPDAWEASPMLAISPRQSYQQEQGSLSSTDDIRHAAEEIERLQAELEAIQRNSAMLRSLTRQQSGDLSTAYSTLEATQEQKEGALEDLQARMSELQGQIETVDSLARELRQVLGLPEPDGGVGGPITDSGLNDDDIDPWLKLRADIVAVEQRAGGLVFDLDEANTEIQLRLVRVQQTGLPRGGSVFDDLEFYDNMPVGWPVEGPITSRFGIRGNPFSGDGEGSHEMHTGIDIAAPTGVPVRATGGGVIQFSGDYGGYGLLVIVDHGRGVTTWYGHNSRLLVSAGQRVGAGDTIAEVGSTGRSTGPHVHYEVRVNGSPRDPLPLMQLER